jgi:hypothetical protein
MVLQMLLVLGLGLCWAVLGALPLLLRVSPGNMLAQHAALVARVLRAWSVAPWIPFWGAGASLLQFQGAFAHLLAAAAALLLQPFGWSCEV